MHMCVRDVDFAFISMIFRLDFGTESCVLSSEIPFLLLAIMVYVVTCCNSSK